jgi:hypothetical protein
MYQQYKEIALKYDCDKINFDILFDSGKLSDILDELKYITSNNISFNWNKYAQKLASIPGEKILDLRKYMFTSMGGDILNESWYYKKGPFLYVPDKYKTYDLWKKALESDLCYIEDMPKEFITHEIEEIIINNYNIIITTYL